MGQLWSAQYVPTKRLAEVKGLGAAARDGAREREAAGAVVLIGVKTIGTSMKPEASTCAGTPASAAASGDEGHRHVDRRAHQLTDGRGLEVGPSRACATLATCADGRGWWCCC